MRLSLLTPDRALPLLKLMVLLLIHGCGCNTWYPQEVSACVPKRDAPNHVEHEVKRVIDACAQLLEGRNGIRVSCQKSHKSALRLMLKKTYEG